MRYSSVRGFTRILKMESLKTLALIIDEKKEEIINNWKSEVLEKLPASKYLSPELLVDSLPYFLDDLSSLLEKNGKGINIGYRDIESMGRDHGRLRADLKEYSLDMVISEYEILSDVILNSLRGDGTEINGDAKAIILASVLKSISSASRGYMDVVLHQQFEVQSSWELKAHHESLERTRLEATLDYLPTGLIILEKDSGKLIFSNRTAERLCGSEKLFDPSGSSDNFYASDHNGLNIINDELPFARVLRGERLRGLRMNWHCLDKTLSLVFHSDILQPVGDGSSRILLVFQETAEEIMVDPSRIINSMSKLLSEDIRKPLELAKINAQFLEKITPVHSSLIRTQKIIEGIEQADDMIRDILDGQKMFAGEKLGLTKEYLELNEEISRVVSRLISIYGDRFIIHSRQEIHGYWGQQALRRIIENLLLNALKFGDRYAPILITLTEEELMVNLGVHSTGPLINEQQRAGIFHDTQVWGIGLPLVRGLAEAHGGEVSVESSLEKGTTFYVKLPSDLMLHGQIKPQIPLSRTMI